VFLLVTLATLPVAMPFVVMHEVGRALRISNGIALAMLFISGWSFGKASGLRPMRVGLVMVVLGAALVALTIALGG
jgi:VIT1/CCC1 family predicted Fe2+/Mn2+ transporter